MNRGDPLNDPAGSAADRARAMLSVLEDLQAERQRLADEIELRRAAEARFRATIEAAPTAMVMIDGDGRMVLVNAETEKLFGYARDELLHQPVEMLVPQRIRAQHPDHRAGFFANPEARRMGVGRDLSGLRKDGSEFSVEIGLSPVHTEEGTFVLGAIADITERKRLEELQARLLEQSEAELQFARIAAAPSRRSDAESPPPDIRGAIVREADETAGDDFATRSFEEALHELALQSRLMVGAHQVAISYVPDGDFQSATHTHSFSEKYAKYETYDAMPTGDGIWGLVVTRRQSVCMTQEELLGHPLWKNFSEIRDARGLEHPPMRGWLAVPILQDDGRLLGVLQSSDKYDGDFDDDDLRLFERLGRMIGPSFSLQLANEEVERRSAELACAKEALEQSNMELQQFAYIASHDLQAPLRGISGFVQLLENAYKGKLDERADEWIGHTVDSVARMQTLIRDLLEFSRVEARAQGFKAIPLRAAFDDAVQMLARSIADLGAHVTCDELPTVAGDRSQMVQLLQNLIGNGVKYHGDQLPCVHLSAEKNGHEWIIAVRDNGIGIDPKHHERVFEIFRRLHTQQEYPGTGIGLAVCRRIVQRHGGRIWFQSERGAGTTFYFTIPEGTTEQT